MHTPVNFTMDRLQSLLNLRFFELFSIGPSLELFESVLETAQ